MKKMPTPRHVIVKFQSPRENENNIKDSKKRKKNKSHTKNQESEPMNFLLEAIIHWRIAFENIRKNYFQCRIWVIYPTNI